ncbi:hypothetical protein [Sphingomonas sp. RS2018]
MTRTELLAIGAAAAVAIGAPLWLLSAGKLTTPSPPPPLTASASAPLAAVYRRPLFAAAAITDETPADAPDLVGIAGRIGRDAVAMVRTADGSTRTLAIGESADGWTLRAVAIDAAAFERGGQEVRVPMPSADEPSAQ